MPPAANDALDDVCCFFSIATVMPAVTPLFPIRAMRSSKSLRPSVLRDTAVPPVAEPHIATASVADKCQIIIDPHLRGVRQWKRHGADSGQSRGRGDSGDDSQCFQHGWFSNFFNCVSTAEAWAHTVASKTPRRPDMQCKGLSMICNEIKHAWNNPRYGYVPESKPIDVASNPSLVAVV